MVRLNSFSIIYLNSPIGKSEMYMHVVRPPEPFGSVITFCSIQPSLARSLRYFQKVVVPLAAVLHSSDAIL